MKNLSLCTVLGLWVFMQSAHAISVTIVTQNEDEFAFDVVWGPTATTYIALENHAPYNASWESAVIAWDYGWYLEVEALSPFVRGGHAFMQFYVPGTDPRDYAPNYPRNFTGVVWDGPDPLSISEIDGGFGAHIVFQAPEDLAQILARYPVNPDPVPEPTSPLMLLGASLTGLALVRRRCS